MKKKWYDLTVLEFCRKHLACDDGRKWALSTGAKTMEELWKRDDIRPDWRIWVATRSGVLDHIMLVRFACFCARQHWNQLAELSAKAIETAEAFCRGEATQEECKSAAYADHAAAYAAAYADHAAAYAAHAAAYAAHAAAYAADAAHAAAYAADAAADAYAADHSAVRQQQAQWLIDNVVVD